MTAYVLRRLLFVFPVLVAVSFLVFATLYLTPGDPATSLAGDDARPEVVAAIRHELGLDEPFWVQFARWTGRTLQGDLGRSIRSNEPVASVIARTIEPTMELAVGGLAVALLIGVPIGIVSAVKRGSSVDLWARFATFAVISLPVFVVGIGLLWLVGFFLQWLPISGRGGPPWTVEGIRHLILPVLTISAFSVALLVRLTRSTMLEVLGQDYLRTARAKGLRERVVLVRHALRNAMLPLITIAGLQFGGLLGGSIVTETIFAWPGMGRTLLDAIATRDLPLVQGIVLFIATVYAVLNLVVDVTYAWLDPRIRYA